MGDKTRISKLFVDNRDSVVVIDFDRPLPNPPAGYYWLKNENDKQWELKQFEVPVNEYADRQTFEQAAVIEHVILPQDTLQGLCLRYRVSAVELRRWNNFSGNNIKFLSSLKIPVEHNQPITIQDHDTPDVMLQRFKTRTHESNSEAIFYLSQNDWKLDLALKQWTDDTKWSEEVNHCPNFCDYVPYDYDAEGEEEDITESDRLKRDKKLEQSRRRGWTVPTGVGLSMGGRSGRSIQAEDQSNVFVDSSQGRLGQSIPPLARVVTPERLKGSDIDGTGREYQGSGDSGGRVLSRSPEGMSGIRSSPGTEAKERVSISQSIFSFFRRKRSLSSTGTSSSSSINGISIVGGGAGTGVPTSTASVLPSRNTYVDPFRVPLMDETTIIGDEKMSAGYPTNPQDKMFTNHYPS